MLNPISIYASSIIGQFDVLPTLIVVLSLYLARKGKVYYSVFLLGIGAAFKHFPFFFLVPACLIMSRKLWKRISLFIVGMLPYWIVVFPFFSAIYIKSVILNQTTIRPMPPFIASFLGKIQALVGFEFPLPVFVAAYSLLVLYLFLKPRNNYDSLWKSFLVVLLIFYATSQFGFHHFLWLMPLLILWVTKNPKYKKIYWLMIILIIILNIYSNNKYFIGIFVPLNSALFYIPSIKSLINPILNILIYILLRGTFSFTCLFLAYRVLKDMYTKKKNENNTDISGI